LPQQPCHGPPPILPARIFLSLRELKTPLAEREDYDPKPPLAEREDYEGGRVGSLFLSDCLYPV